MNLKDLLSQFQVLDQELDAEFPNISAEYKLLARLSKITEELGELSSEVLGSLQLHRQEKQAKHDQTNLAREWADVISSVILLGIALKLDIPEVLENQMSHIFERYQLSRSTLTKPTFHAGVIISIVDDQDRILLAKRSLTKTHAPGVWESISGAIEANEQPLDALHREIQEELGKSVRYQVIKPYNAFTTTLDNGREIVGISYLCRYQGGEIVLNHEHTEFAWVDLDQAIVKTATEGLKQEFKLLKHVVTTATTA